MKKLYTLLTLLMLSLTSCEVSESEFGTITIDDEYASITLDGGATTKMASFKSTVSWKAIITNNMSDNDNTPTWISISQTSGSAGNSTIDIEVETNKTGSSRSAVIKIYSSFAQKEIIVTQNYDRYSDEDENTDENEDEDEDDEGNTLSQTVTLSELSSSQYPTNSSIWRITDTNATSEDMSGLRSALTSYYNSTGNTVSLEFPNLKSMPEYGLNSCDGVYAVTLSRATTIEIWAFSCCENLTNVSLPAATSIKYYAFDCCTNLTMVSPLVATTIEDGAFYDCNNLTEISLPVATTIGKCAFYDCNNLTEISLPVATSAGEAAFSKCINLSEISLPATTYIEHYTFQDCDNLTEISLPAATTIGSRTFKNCENLRTLEIATNSNVIISSCYPSAFEGVTLSNVTLTVGSANSSMVSGNYITIDGYEFGPFKEIIVNDSASGGDASDDKTSYSLSELSSSSYPTNNSTWVITDTNATESDFFGLKSALSSYYSSTSNTVSLEFPNLISMPNYGLGFCNEINAITLSKATTIESSAFYDCENLTEISLPAATSIGSYAFYDCTSLTEVSLPAATSIGIWAFAYCDNLTEVSLPAATSIGSSAFYSCDNLTTVSLPAATSIGSSAFYWCDNLTEVSLPAATSIDTWAFNCCDNLTTLEIATNSKVIIDYCSSWAFNGVTLSNVTLTVGSANSSMVSGNYITIGSTKFGPFKEIITK